MPGGARKNLYTRQTGRYAAVQNQKAVYLLTCKVIRYCFLALRSNINHLTCLSTLLTNVYLTCSPASQINVWHYHIPLSLLSILRIVPLCFKGRDPFRYYDPRITKESSKHLYNIYTTSAQRLRRWSNIVQMFYKCFVFAGRTVLAMDLGCGCIEWTLVSRRTTWGIPAEEPGWIGHRIILISLISKAGLNQHAIRPGAFLIIVLDKHNLRGFEPWMNDDNAENALNIP